MPRSILWILVTIVFLAGLSVVSRAEPVMISDLLITHPHWLNYPTDAHKSAEISSRASFSAQSKGAKFSEAMMPEPSGNTSLNAQTDRLSGVAVPPDKPKPPGVLAAPEPAVIILLGTGLVITASRLRRKNRNKPE
jgi:hypothetical protein